MTFSLSLVEWWTPSASWGQNLSAPTDAQKTEIEGYLNKIASTAAGAAELARYSASDTLKIGIGPLTQAQHAQVAGWYALSFDPLEVDYQINPHGEWVQAAPVLTLAHELAHMDLSQGAGITPDPASTPAYLNAANADYDGHQVSVQNQVAVQLHMDSNVQVSYGSGIGVEELLRNGFDVGRSYTDNQQIDAVRYSRQLHEVIDTSQSPNGLAASRDLVFALAGDDTVTTGAGADFVYASAGADSVDGGADQDRLAGGLGNDTLAGGAGDDLLLSQGGSDSLAGGAGDDVYDIRSAHAQGSEVITLSVKAGDGHDYLMTDPLPTPTTPDGMSVWAIPPHAPTVRILLTDYSYSQVTFLTDQHDLFTDPQYSGRDDRYATGHLALQLPTGDTLYLGGAHERLLNGAEYSGDVNFEFVFSDGVAHSLSDLLYGAPDSACPLEQVASMTPYIGALASWPSHPPPPDDTPATPQSVAGGADEGFLYGGSAADTLAAGAGADLMMGGAGNDTYVWARGAGAASIYDAGDSADAGDRLVLQNIASTDVALGWAGNDLVLRVAPSAAGAVDGGEIVLQGQLDDHTSWGVGIDDVVFSDGVVWTAAGMIQTIHSQLTPGADNFVGGDGAETIRGGHGNDLLEGSGGDDTYQWAHGDGDDTLTDSGWDANDTLAFDDVSSDQVTVGHDDQGAARLVIAPSTAGGDGGMLSVQVGWGDGDLSGIDRIVFSDGVVWTQADLYPRLLASYETAGNDEIYGYNTRETIAAGGGDDLVHGGSADDLFVWSPGDGADTIDDWSGRDQLALHTVAPGQVTASADGADVILQIGGAGGGEIRLVEELHDDDRTRPFGVETVAFDDGTTWDVSEIEALIGGAVASYGAGGNDSIAGSGGQDLLFGTAGDDTLDGGSGSDVLDGGTGDNRLTGGSGADLFDVRAGAGSAVITDFSGADGDRVETPAGMTFADVQAGAHQVGADLVIDLAGGGGVTLAGVPVASLQASWFMFT